MTKTANGTSWPALLITLGIIYGDIGTSPLYVYKAIFGPNDVIQDSVVLGAFSCIFWTLTLQTTIKYVLLTLNADNNGEGGIFALYALVRRSKRWLLWAAIIGGSALLADGIITPPISVASAVEGLRIIIPDLNTVPLVILILTGLFAAQWFGTAKVGSTFGWFMLVWFMMLAVTGLSWLCQFPVILLALNPMYAFELLLSHPGGFWLLGAVFLCTTGAEALYSDLGHCGKRNIRLTWIFVKSCLLLNYAGQGAWLLVHHGKTLGELNPFYQIIPQWFLVPGIIIATCATVIASQALISGSFTLVTEAMRLNLFPKFKVVYPTELKGQIYVPAVNWLLFLGCVGIVLYFRESSNMEAAYGLAITITMLATTVLMGNYLIRIGRPRFSIWAFFAVYFLIEVVFLIANLRKFPHGGWVALLVGFVIAAVMGAWNRGSRTSHRFSEYLEIADYLQVLKALSHDSTIPKYATHLVYMTKAENPLQVDANIIYSIIRQNPKRADTYWFVHVDVVDEPYRMDYRVHALLDQTIFRVDFELGFRVEPRIGVLFTKVINEMACNGEVDLLSRYKSLRKTSMCGDLRFVVIERFLSYDNVISAYDRLVMRAYFLLKQAGASSERIFGLDSSAVSIESVPLVIAPVRELELVRQDR